MFQKSRSIRDILPHNGNRSEGEDLKIKAEYEFEEKQCGKKLSKYPWICHIMRVYFLTQVAVRRKAVTGGRLGSSVVLSHCCLSSRLLPERHGKDTKGTISPERTTRVSNSTVKQ